MTDFDEMDQYIETLEGPSKGGDFIELSVEEYYVDKYQKESKEVLNVRLNEIDLNIATINNELALQKESFKNIDQIVLDNKGYQEEIERIKTEVAFIDNEVRKIQNEYDPIIEQLKSKQVILANATLGYYNSIVELCEPIDDPDAVMDKCESTIKIMKQQLYPMATDCTLLRFDAYRVGKRLEKKIIEVDEAKQHYNDEILELSKKIAVASKDEINKKIDNLNERIKRNNELKKELKDTFKIINEKNIDKIVDTLKYETLKQTTRKDLLPILNSLVEVMITNLKSQDTLQSLKKMHELKIKEIESEIDNYIGIEDEYKLKLSIEKEYAKTIIAAIQNLDELNAFVDNVKLIIDENEAFSQAYNEYQRIAELRSQCQAQLDIAEPDLNKAKLELNDKTIYATNNDVLRDLNEKVHGLNDLVNELRTKIINYTSALNNIEKDPSNLKLFVVIKEKQEIESSLPKLYADVQELKAKDAAITKEIKELGAKLKQLEELKSEMAKLNYELNNQ